MAHLLSSVRSHPPAAGIVGMAPTPGLHVVAAFGGFAALSLASTMVAATTVLVLAFARLTAVGQT